MRCWWPWPLTGTAERPQNRGLGGRAADRCREAPGSLMRDGAASTAPRSQPESPPPPPLAPLQTTTSLSKPMYSVVRRTQCSFFAPCCPSCPQISVQKPP